jgi:MFS family permease
VASAAITATADNYFNAFAIFLQASALQLGFLTAIPQLFGAVSQLLSIWLCQFLPRRLLVVGCAALQASAVAMLSVLACVDGENRVIWLIVLVCVHFVCGNLIQPQWRAWMGSVVPARRRGAFFAARTRLTQIASLCIFIGGGLVLNSSEALGSTALGFALVFLFAAGGRFTSSWLLFEMHDPDQTSPSRKGVFESLRQFRHSLRDESFRHYSIFFAGMTGVVSISAPFFAVYMLSELKFSYLEYALNHVASIATQFLMLNWWGRNSDRFGNRLVMLSCALMIPTLPILWTVSSNWYYLLLAQVFSGFAWSGFTLSAANYLYDIRPQRSDFAVYAAVQSGLSALAIFVGAIAGGYLASHAAGWREALGLEKVLASPLFLVFYCSSMLRLAFVLWFIPRAREPVVRRRPRLLQLVLRVARFNPISGVSMDWLTVTKKPSQDMEKEEERRGPGLEK